MHKDTHTHKHYYRGADRYDLWPDNQSSMRFSVLYKGATSSSQILLQMHEQSRLMWILSFHPLSQANTDFTFASAPQSHTQTE